MRDAEPLLTFEKDATNRIAHVTFARPEGRNTP